MTYDSWNDLICKYYFRNTSESKVIFHITLQDLVEFVKEENVEIAKDRFAAEFSDEFIRTDFVSKFWIDIKTGNRNIDDLQDKIIKRAGCCIPKLQEPASYRSRTDNAYM